MLWGKTSSTHYSSKRKVSTVSVEVERKPYLNKAANATKNALKKKRE